MTDFESYLNDQGLENYGAVDEPVEQETPEASATEEVASVEAPVEETPVETVAETTEPELILGKYKSTDDAIKALEHAQSEIGRLRIELGEARGNREPREPVVPQQPVDPNVVEEAFAANPTGARQAAQRAATLALQQGDANAYEQILETWSQYDGFGALRFESARQADQVRQQTLAQIAPQVQTAQQYAEQSANQAATQTIQSRHPDFNEVVGDLTDETRVQQLVHEGFPMDYLQAATGTQAQKEQLLETIYRWKKAEQVETAANVAPQVAADAAAENRAAKQQAAVASASSTPAVETTSETDDELKGFYEYLLAPSPTSWADVRIPGQ